MPRARYDSAIRLQAADCARGAFADIDSGLAAHVLGLDVIAFGLTHFAQFDPQQRIVGLDAQRAFDRGGGDGEILRRQLRLRLADQRTRGGAQRRLANNRCRQRLRLFDGRRRRRGLSFDRGRLARGAGTDGCVGRRRAIRLRHRASAQSNEQNSQRE